MQFTDEEKTDVRRFCGYPAYGAGAAGFQSWRFYQAYGTLEFRMNNLAPPEIAVVRSQLASLRSLEQGLFDSAMNLDTNEAATWQRNPNETRDRQYLFDDMRRRFCGFFGVPTGPALGGSGLAWVV